MEVTGHLHTIAPLVPPFPLDKELGGLQSHFGRRGIHLALDVCTLFKSFRITGLVIRIRVLGHGNTCILRLQFVALY
jgi:hypothetical protein